MSLFIVDVEADGPYPGGYSMVSFGIVKVTPELNYSLYSGIIEPISSTWIPEALAVSGVTRDEMLTGGRAPVTAMQLALNFVEAHSDGKPVFISDNPAFDWQFMNYYFHKYAGKNPFGFSARRIGDFYAGLEKNWKKANDWKKMRQTKHTHNPVDDARGNAEALLNIAKKHNIQLPL